MTHVEPIHHCHRYHLGLLPGLLLTATLDFAAGQTWPLDSEQAGIEQPAPEDWRGNVRRSYWTD